ncbi:hypothetical protein NMY22_g14803 [Coprinellus aureogranulatus]|nr:hypothetical protein NMY22_g14803 [Coprinellus aureogranulatus]
MQVIERLDATGLCLCSVSRPQAQLRRIRQTDIHDGKAVCRSGHDTPAPCPPHSPQAASGAEAFVEVGTTKRQRSEAPSLLTDSSLPRGLTLCTPTPISFTMQFRLSAVLVSAVAVSFATLALASPLPIAEPEALVPREANPQACQITRSCT